MSIIYNHRYHRDHESNRTKVLLKLWQKEERLPKIRRLLNATDTDSTAQTQLALMDLKHLVKLDDEEILKDACWTLYYLLEGHRDEYQAVANANVLPRLLELLNYHSHSVIYAALLTVGNLVRHDTDNPITPVSFDEGGGVLAGDVQTKNIINNGGLPFIRNLLTHKHHTVSIKKEACWILSRITAESTQQIQAVIDANIVSVLVELVESAEFCIRKEALLAIKFVAFGGTTEQIRYLVDQGCIKQVCRLLGFIDSEIVRDCLELIHYIFRSDPSRYGPVIRSQVRHQLRFLQGHVSNDIRDYAKELLHDLDESCIAAPLDKSAYDNEILSVLAPTLHKRPCMDRDSQLDELEKRFKADEQHFLPLFELIGKAKGNDPVFPPHTIPPAPHSSPLAPKMRGLLWLGPIIL